MVISQLAGSRHITWTKPWPEPKAWAGFGFWRPKAQAWILLGPAQAKLGQAEPAHHYSQPTIYNATNLPLFLAGCCERILHISRCPHSGVKVRFSPVQHPFFLNPELDFWFSSDKSLNFEPNLRFRSSSVRTQFKPFKIITKKFSLKKLIFTILTIYWLHIYISKFEAS